MLLVVWGTREKSGIDLNLGKIGIGNRLPVNWIISVVQLNVDSIETKAIMGIYSTHNYPPNGGGAGFFYSSIQHGIF